MKLPYIAWYVGDWRKDTGVQSLNFHDRGVWFEILCLMHESGERGKLLLNGQPMPDDTLSRLLGLDRQVLGKTLSMLLSSGVASRCSTTGALMSRRMVRDEVIRGKRIEAGKLGGNPALLNQKDKPPDNTSHKPKLIYEDDILVFCIREGIGEGMRTACFPDAWRDWRTYRSESEFGPLTPFTAKAQLQKCERMGAKRAVAAIRIAIEKGWKNLLESHELSTMNGAPAASPPRPPREPEALPAWKSTVDEIRTLLANPDANAARLAELGESLPRAAWSSLDGVKEINRLKVIMKRQKESALES